MKPIFKLLLLVILASLLSTGCTPITTPLPPIETASPMPPTDTIEPTASSTATETPTATPLPGVEVLPLDRFARGNPWLPLDEDAQPVIQGLFFDLQVPPFNDVLIRQAFAYAIDREAAVAVAKAYLGNYALASTFIPSQILGRDLYGEVGISYDPAKAQELLGKSGITDPATLPPITMIAPAYGTKYPYARTLIANKIAAMWQENLGITVTVRSLNFPQMAEARQSGTIGIIFLGWLAGSDPDIINVVFHSNSENNQWHYNSATFDNLVKRAAFLLDPAERQPLYIEAERLVCEIDTVVYPLYVQLP